MKTPNTTFTLQRVNFDTPESQFPELGQWALRLETLCKTSTVRSSTCKMWVPIDKPGT